MFRYLLLVSFRFVHAKVLSPIHTTRVEVISMSTTLKKAPRHTSQLHPVKQCEKVTSSNFEGLLPVQNTKGGSSCLAMMDGVG